MEFVNQAFAFVEQEEVEEKHDVVKEILQHAQMGEPEDIVFLGSCLNYDSFRVSIGQWSYTVKYTLDDTSYRGLRNEAKILQSGHCACQPIYVDSGRFKFGDWVEYLIVSHEYADSVEDIGKQQTMELAAELTEAMAALQFNSLPNIGVIDWILDEAKATNISRETFGEIGDDELFDAISAVRKNVLAELNILMKNPALSKNQFCHGNLKPSNILCRDGFFKFINFTKSFQGSSFLDLASVAIYLGLDTMAEKILFKEFMAAIGVAETAAEWNDYRCCHAVMIRIIFLRSLFGLIHEQIFFEPLRTAHILNHVLTFNINLIDIVKIPCLRDFMEPIYNFMNQPLKQEDLPQVEE